MNSTNWIGPDSTCEKVRCPALPLPEGVLVSPASCSTASNAPGSKCNFTCGCVELSFFWFKLFSSSDGYKHHGSSAAECGKRRKWKFSNMKKPTCTKEITNFPPPFILCPTNVTKPLPHGSSSVYVMFSQPKTNVDWFRLVFGNRRNFLDFLF